MKKVSDRLKKELKIMLDPKYKALGPKVNVQKAYRAIVELNEEGILSDKYVVEAQKALLSEPNHTCVVDVIDLT